MTQLVSVRSFPVVNRRRVFPEGVVYIGRAIPRAGLKASPWGNPYRPGSRLHPHGHPEQRYGNSVLPARPCSCRRLEGSEEVYWAYENWLDMRLLVDPDYLEPLRGKTIACWCERPRWCHGTAILEALECHRPQPKPGERIEFGRHAMPPKEAEAAPAWPSLATVEARNLARFRREQNKATA